VKRRGRSRDKSQLMKIKPGRKLGRSHLAAKKNLLRALARGTAGSKHDTEDTGGDKSFTDETGNIILGHGWGITNKKSIERVNHP
jgi:hypothetical protein